MPHIDEAFPSKYVRASDLRNKPQRVIVSHVAYEIIDNKQKLIMFFEDKEKGLVLNKTNATTIAAIYGSDTDDWAGGELELFPTMVDYQGKQVEAVRVRIPPRKPAPRGDVTVAPNARARSAAEDDLDARSGGAAPAMADDDIPFAPEWR